MNGLRNFTFSTKLKGYGFHGQLDDLRIYDRLLTESEIIDIYEMGEFASKLASVDAKDDSKNGLTLVEKKFEDAMKKPVGEGIHIVESAANMEMIWCKPGSFLMGSPKSQKGRSISGTQYKVSLTEGFYLGKYEVTQEEYEKVMGKNSSNFKGKKLPVEMVSWNDAMEFCKKLTGLEKKEGRVPDGWTYILPTEAQWEYACRAGTTTFYSWGNEINLKLANYRDSKIGKTSEVGFYQSNPWGLFDMHGNVWEWVHDWQGNYPREAVNNPHGPASGSARAGRGGSWSATGMSLRSAERYGYTPSKHSRNIGFRVCFKQEIDDEK
jgi:formylglycine-generating enzyme required for sulfatase activity